jgi:hypothetical protein
MKGLLSHQALVVHQRTLEMIWVYSSWIFLQQVMVVNRILRLVWKLSIN